MGAPCEEEQSCRTHPANVSAGRGELAAILDWDAPTLGDLSPTDMDLEVFNPKGEQVSGMQSASQNKPEIFTLKGNMTGGDWHFRVVNYAGTNLAYTLTVEVTYGTAANRTGNATLTPRS